MKRPVIITLAIIAILALIVGGLGLIGYIDAGRGTAKELLETNKNYIRVDKDDFQKTDWLIIEAYFERVTNTTQPTATIKFKSGEKLKIRYDGQGRYEEYIDLKGDKYYVTPLIDLESPELAANGLALCRIVDGNVKLVTKTTKPTGINGVK